MNMQMSHYTPNATEIYSHTLGTELTYEMLHGNDEQAPGRDIVLPRLLQLQFETHPGAGSSPGPSLPFPSLHSVGVLHCCVPLLLCGHQVSESTFVLAAAHHVHR